MQTAETIKTMLRAHGVRVTEPRVVVLQALQGGQGHMSAEEVHLAAVRHYPCINLVTVYRTLETLEAHGLAARVVLGDKVTRWEHTGHAHHHVICQCCGAVVDLDDAPFQRLADDLERTAGVRVDVRHLALHGLCARCAAGESLASPS